MNVIEINIGSRVFTVKTDENDEHVKKVEKIINEHLDMFAMNRKYNEAEKLIIASFTISDKYLKLLKEVNELKEEYKFQIQESKEKIISLYKENEELRNKIDSIIKEKEELSTVLNLQKDNQEKSFSTIENLEKLLSEKEQRQIQIEIELEELRTQTDSLNEKCLELSSDREKFLSNLSKAEQEKNELNSRISKMLSRLNEKDKTISDNELVISQNKKTINDLSQKLNVVNDSTKKSSDSIKALEDENDKLTYEISTMKQKLAEKDDIIGQNYKFIEELKILKDEISKKHDRVGNEKEKYLEELLLANSEIESLKFSINEMNEKLNRKEAENYQNSVYIEELKKENSELMGLLDAETSGNK